MTRFIKRQMKTVDKYTKRLDGVRFRGKPSVGTWAYYMAEPLPRYIRQSRSQN